MYEEEKKSLRDSVNLWQFPLLACNLTLGNKCYIGLASAGQFVS